MWCIMNSSLKFGGLTIFLILVLTNRVFDLRNELVHHLITPHFFVWFVEWNELIHHHLIPHS
jgi:hypothetical protein